MKITLFPTLIETVELHSKLIERFGGKDGVRDLGLLESALWRPQSSYYDTLSLQAAALLQSLTQNHSLIDGYKRVAFATTAIFLRMNGYCLKVDADNGEFLMIETVIKNKASIEVIAAWLEKHMHVVD
ncbi:MAG: type II toxin-antitoxin system death-on-curing family toxin [Bdellovibrionota bacterium]